MSDLQVTCINKTPRNDPHQGITYLGGAGFKYSRQQVVDFINGRIHTFYTKTNGVRAEIGVNGNAPNQWVQTYADKQWNNNLLALPECR
ncbi:DUF3892 domain-containing protein [Phenylobacterium sp.]|uniref:DUF3892 domain-containing protein n=1 Tax=Phenylobacterium sp. TaxID=1871053 RepID=UPI00272F539D|nr:DUF3892 domain-containing protein [Phenylobacterium sp.]MDP1598719.1 DUF3892 domain-containing protein [Phenylobacterium sp.]